MKEANGMKRKISPGQLISLIGTFILCVGLALNGFEIVPVAVFRLIVALGIAAQAVALVFILKRNEF